MGGVLVSVLDSLYFCIYCTNSDSKIRVSQLPNIMIDCETRIQDNESHKC